jgi:formiminoglutamase
MKDISIFFKPVEEEQIPTKGLGTTILYHKKNNFPHIEKGGIALFYVPEYRNSNYHVEENVEYFRSEFAQLQSDSNWQFSIYDLGTILPGKEVNDTFHAVTNVCAELIQNNVLPIIVGGSQDLTLAIYQALAKNEQSINLCSIDREFDLGDADAPIHANGFLSHILVQKPCYLFNYSVIGYQTPYVSSKERDLFEKLYFDTCRLGTFTKNTTIAEPLLRNSNAVSFDLSSINASDFEGKYYNAPNGISGMHACQLMYYAGASDKMATLLLSNYFSDGISLKANRLLSELIWYFIDGFACRVGDFPVGSREDYTKFSVVVSHNEEPLVFLKSNKSARWWMEVPYPKKKDMKYERSTLVPCDYSDYQEAMKDELPNLWWKTYQKLT